MSRFVKKVGKVEYYEIDGIRASGIIPYYIKNNEVKILINLEFRNAKLVYKAKTIPLGVNTVKQIQYFDKTKAYIITNFSIYKKVSEILIQLVLIYM